MQLSSSFLLFLTGVYSHLSIALFSFPVPEKTYSCRVMAWVCSCRVSCSVSGTLPLQEPHKMNRCICTSAITCFGFNWLFPEDHYNICGLPRELLGRNCYPLLSFFFFGSDYFLCTTIFWFMATRLGFFGDPCKPALGMQIDVHAPRRLKFWLHQLTSDLTRSLLFSNCISMQIVEASMELPGSIASGAVQMPVGRVCVCEWEACGAARW